MTETLVPEFEIEVFYDGGCPLCLREISMLRSMDRRYRIHFIDIDDPSFRPFEYGKTLVELMARMHGRLPNGTWIEGVEVFRRLYSAVGFRWLVALTRIPGVSHLLDFGYAIFARYRLKMTGRCTRKTCGPSVKS